MVPTKVGPTKLAVTMGTVHTPIRATATRGQEPIELAARWDSQNKFYGVGFFDPRVSVAHPWSEHVLTQVFFGLSSSGAELVWFPSGLQAQTPIALTASAQVDQFFLMSTKNLPRFAARGRVGAAAHPRIASWLRGTVGLGASYGRHRHGLTLPAYLEENEDDNHMSATMIVLRPELRVDGIVGVQFVAKGFAGIALTAQPYLTAAAGRTLSDCFFCEEVKLDSFNASAVGVALMVTLFAD